MHSDCTKYVVRVSSTYNICSCVVCERLCALSVVLLWFCGVADRWRLCKIRVVCVVCVESVIGGFIAIAFLFYMWCLCSMSEFCVGYVCRVCIYVCACVVCVF